MAAAPVYLVPQAPALYVPYPSAGLVASPGQVRTPERGLREIISDIEAVIDLLDRLRERLRRDGSRDGEPSGWRELQQRVDRLDLAVRRNTEDIADLVRSQQELANRIDAELEKLRAEDQRLAELMGKSKVGSQAAPDAQVQAMAAEVKRLDDAIAKMARQVQRCEVQVRMLRAAGDRSEEAQSVLAEAEKVLSEKKAELQRLQKERDQQKKELQQRLQGRK